MDAVIAQTCSVVALAMVTVWALVAAETSREESEAYPRHRAARAVCTPDVCSIVRCRTVTEEECPASLGTIDPHGGWCGCCPSCLRHIGENESCAHLYLQGVPPTSKCAPGLTCKDGICTSSSSS